MPNLDPFSERRFPDVADRFLREQRRHERQASLMWAGTLVAMFSDHELGLLDELGFLSQRDHDLLRQAGRQAKSGPGAAVAYTDADRSYDLHAVEADYGRPG